MIEFSFWMVSLFFLFTTIFWWSYYQEKCIELNSQEKIAKINDKIKERYRLELEAFYSAIARSTLESEVYFDKVYVTVSYFNKEYHCYLHFPDENQSYSLDTTCPKRFVDSIIYALEDARKL